MLTKIVWIFHITGVLLVVTGSAGLGIGICMEQRLRIRELESFEKFLRLSAGEISYGKTRLSELFAEVGEHMGQQMGNLLSKIGERLDDGKGDSFEEIWREEMAGFLRESHLKKEERRLIMAFPAEFGFPDVQRLQMALERLGMEIGQKVKRQRQQQINQERVTMALCLAGGVAAAILLL